MTHVPDPTDVTPFFGSKLNRPGSNCCGKPHGCTNITESCLFRNHQWKRLYVSGHPLACPPDAHPEDIR